MNHNTWQLASGIIQILTKIFPVIQAQAPKEQPCWDIVTAPQWSFDQQVPAQIRREVRFLHFSESRLYTSCCSSHTVILCHRQYPVKHYIKEAKRLKHKADAEVGFLCLTWFYNVLQSTEWTITNELFFPAL